MTAAAIEGCEVNSLAKQVADGFDTLSIAYKALAARHESLENSLKTATAEAIQFRRLLQEKYPPGHRLQSPSDLVIIEEPADRDLCEWVRTLSNDIVDSSSKQLSQIERAESASHRIKLLSRSAERREQLKGSTRTSAIMDVESFGCEKMDRCATELNFTTHNKPSELGCPFASRTGPKPEGHPPVIRGRNLPTPRSSTSLHSAPGRRSKRPSFHDPISSGAAKSVPFSSEASEGEGGPVCPIRFLDQHTPEDVAKYFEEHKHELPRSHEVCVKRFETNSEMIRELDSKYGSLVNMIQGLGQKHQPLLPGTPLIEEEEDNDEAESNDKVEKWANAVSESMSTKDETQNTASEEKDEKEERMSHFDRPLKEVRVGESPSRPWGVPIPSKYLDRASDDASIDSPAPRPVTSKDTKLVEPKKAGKCPFGFDETPAKTVAIDTKETATVEPKTGITKSLPTLQDAAEPAVYVEPNLEGTRPRQVSNLKKTEAFESVETVASKHTKDPSPSHITNHGVMIVSPGLELTGVSLENHGTLVLGYSTTDAASIADRLRRQG